jgi:hypothetical protein
MPETALPNVASIIQAIVGQPRWLAGHALPLYLSGILLRKVRLFDDAAAGAPRLVVACERSTDARVGVSIDAMLRYALMR